MIFEFAQQRCEICARRNAGEVHQAVTGRTKTRRRDLAKNRHIVRVEHAETEPVKRGANDHEPERRRKTDPSQRRYREQQARRARPSAATNIALRKQVGNFPADRCARISLPSSG